MCFPILFKKKLYLEFEFLRKFAKIIAPVGSSSMALIPVVKCSRRLRF
jgi:hypothetical protein